MTGLIHLLNDRGWRGRHGICCKTKVVIMRPFKSARQVSHKGKVMKIQGVKPLLMTVLLAMTGWAAASEPAAGITGTLDGEDQQWFILDPSSEPSATFIEEGDRWVVEMTGYRDPEKWVARDALVIQLVLTDERLTNARVLHLIGDAVHPPYYTASDDELTVVLSRVEREGSRLHLQGTLEGPLALQHSPEADPLAEEGVSLAVTFDVTARKVEF